MGGAGSGTPKGEIIRLDGVQIDQAGVESKTEFFRFLKMDLSDYADFEMSAQEAVRFRNQVIKLRYGTSALIPILCSGIRCPIKQCPFHENKNYPLTKQCVLEVRLIQAKTLDYVEELGIDPENATQMLMVNKLVECDVIDYRANAGLAGSIDDEAPSLLKTNRTESEYGVSETVTAHPLLEVKERNNRMRMQILEALTATPKEKYKKAAALKKHEDVGASKQWAEMRTAVEKIKGHASSVQQIKKDAAELAALDQKQGVTDADWEAPD